ncbi:MAG: hypothetical protein PHR86_04380, partial [Desulfobacterales bacterium]|nr:hypothetical protein [Desulfobacterales bacterium]
RRPGTVGCGFVYAKPCRVAVNLHELAGAPADRAINRVLKNKNQAVRQGARRYDKRSIFKHM